MTPELEQAIENAEKEIGNCVRKGLRMTIFTIRQNIKLVKENPEEFSKDFIKMYSNK